MVVTPVSFAIFSRFFSIVSTDLADRKIRDEVTDEDLQSLVESVTESSKGQTAKEIRMRD